MHRPRLPRCYCHAPLHCLPSPTSLPQCPHLHCTLHTVSTWHTIIRVDCNVFNGRQVSSSSLPCPPLAASSMRWVNWSRSCPHQLEDNEALPHGAVAVVTMNLVEKQEANKEVKAVSKPASLQVNLLKHQLVSQSRPL